jgi:hypothetical protein
MTLSTKWARATALEIKTGELPEGKIRVMRSILARAINKAGNDWMSGTPSCNRDDADAIIELLEEHTPRVTEDQARKGADWLYSQVFTSRGNVRATAFAAEFSEADRAIILQLRARPHFELVGFYDTRENGERYCTLYPLYKAVGESSSFIYAARSWQAGGNSFVTKHA